MEAKKYAKKQFTFYDTDLYTHTVYTVRLAFDADCVFIHGFDLFLEIETIDPFTKTNLYFPTQFDSSISVETLSDEKLLYFMINFFATEVKIRNSTMSDQDFSKYRTIILSTLMSSLAGKINSANSVKNKNPN